MSIYLIRVGEGSKYIEEARRDGFVAIGWEKIDDLSKFKDLQQIKKVVEHTYKYTPTKLAISAGQICRFGLEIKFGDMIVSPLGKGEYLVGEAGEYYYEKNLNGCPYSHRRKVRWLDKVLRKDDMSTNLSYSLGGLLTIFSLDKYVDEIKALLQGDKYTPAEKPTRVRDVILSALLELKGDDFEKFIKHLLDIIGFRAEVTQYVGDKGIDVTGTLNAEGLAEIKLQVQAKRYEKGSVGSRVVREMKGSLGLDEHGCIITTATFSSDAIEEADKVGHKAIKLIDGDDLADIILRNFDLLDENYKNRFQIRRKKDFKIEDQFEIPGVITEEKIASPLNTKGKMKGAWWDTLVCAAKEDGFRYAFLESKAWWAVRLNPDTLPYIKYLAIYQIAPVSQITYYGEVDRIEPYEGKEWGEDKYKLYLKGDPIKLKNPIGLGARPHLKPQGPKYASLDKILKAKTLDDIWG